MKVDLVFKRWEDTDRTGMEPRELAFGCNLPLVGQDCAWRQERGVPRRYTLLVQSAVRLRPRLCKPQILCKVEEFHAPCASSWLQQHGCAFPHRENLHWPRQSAVGRTRQQESNNNQNSKDMKQKFKRLICRIFGHKKYVEVSALSISVPKGHAHRHERKIRYFVLEETICERCKQQHPDLIAENTSRAQIEN